MTESTDKQEFTMDKLRSEIRCAVADILETHRATRYVTALGRDLREATEDLCADENCTFDNCSRFEILSARRVSAEVIVQWAGREDERVEAWEFEVYCHP